MFVIVLVYMQNRSTYLTFFIFVVMGVLLNFPMLSIFNKLQFKYQLPILYLSIFTIWLIGILLLLIIDNLSAIADKIKSAKATDKSYESSIDKGKKI